MQATKRKRTDEGTECLITNQNASAGKEAICSYTSGEAGFRNLSKCGESSSIELDTRVASVLSQVVVSLASFVGDTMHYRCAGIFVQGSYANDTFVLTSADLVRSSIDEKEIIDNLTIKVRLPDN